MAKLLRVGEISIVAISVFAIPIFEYVTQSDLIFRDTSPLTFGLAILCLLLCCLAILIPALVGLWKLCKSLFALAKGSVRDALPLLWGGAKLLFLSIAIPLFLLLALAKPHNLERDDVRLIVKCPSSLRLGSSATLKLIVELSRLSDVSPPMRLDEYLSHSGKYKVNATIQAPNFEVAESELNKDVYVHFVGRNEFQTCDFLWVVTPKEKRLGVQQIVFQVSVQDADGNDVGTRPYYETEILVCDPIGLPAWVYHLSFTLGGLAGAKWLISWLFGSYFSFRSQRSKESKEIWLPNRDSQANRKWWKFWE